MGYVGIPMAVLLAAAGNDVTGIQRKSPRSGWKIDWLNEGRCPIGGNEPELPELLKKVVDNGNFRVTDDYGTVKNSDIILIDVQTPTDDTHIPRYESLKEVCRNIGGFLKPGKIIVIESTVAPGTTENMVKPVLEENSGLKAGLPGGFGLCFSYERVMVGRLIHNIRHYPKIVGGIDDESARQVSDVYRDVVQAGVHRTDIMTAEVSKTVENAYRDVQIAFANEVALLCESLGIDVYKVREFVNNLPNDPSVPHANPVRNMLFPGAGVGGYCLPKDTWLLMYGYEAWGGDKSPYPFSLLTGARHLNDWMPVHTVDLLGSALKEAGRDLKGAVVAVLGYAFLENSDDPRNTPTVSLLRELEKRSVTCRIHDPYLKKDEGYVISQDLAEVLKGADALILMTRHNEYKAVTPEMLKKLMRTKVVIDGRNAFDDKAFTAAGFVVRTIGKGNV